MLRRFAVRLIATIFWFSFVLPIYLLSQTEVASLVGTVRDAQGAAVPGAKVQITRLETGAVTASVTSEVGLYVFPGLQPGHYRIVVTKTGFKEDVVEGLLLSVQDRREQNFLLTVGSVSETVNVEASAEMINTQDASVSTVVDRQFADNLPLNGRSFQTLIELTPGVVVAASNSDDSGQFNVNGQRAAANYWTVDGVSANVGSSAFYGGNQIAGAIGTTSIMGGTNGLVSVDAMQEFRIQTSTFAPEFGRTPGGQISIVTRSGTNKFHGTLFDYLRNDAMDANNWFNGVSLVNPTPIAKPEERQNDFGGTFEGPIFKDKTFFFFSYEGIRLRLPQTALTIVPDASFTPGTPGIPNSGTTNSRTTAQAAMQPYLNVFPLPNPNSPEILCSSSTAYCPASGETGSAAFNTSYSNPSTLDAYSLRVDHRLTNRVSIFARYNDSPSQMRVRGIGAPLNNVSAEYANVKTATAGLDWQLSNRMTDEFRFNYSRTDAGSDGYLDNFGGGVPLATVPLPSPYSLKNADFYVSVYTLQNTFLDIGPVVDNVQRQINLVDGFSLQRGSHAIKFGFDYRRLTPQVNPFQYGFGVGFDNVPDFGQGSLLWSQVSAQPQVTFLFRNISAYAQDTWRVRPHFTLTYGVRWDTDVAPSTVSGPNVPGLTGFNLNNFSTLALAPAGTPPFKTTYGNFAPRIGIAYQLNKSDRWATVARGGFGVFYDLATSETDNVIDDAIYPFEVFEGLSNTAFPFTGPPAPAIVPPTATSGVLGGFDPNLKLPYTLQWNVSFEQALGKSQTITASYVGASGRRLLQTAIFTSPGVAPYQFSQAVVTVNTGSSDYDALQLQFNRAFSRGLQLLASYTWSHSIDTASAGSTYVGSNAFDANEDRGDSDFDLRHNFSAGFTYAVPTAKSNSLLKAVTGGWSLEGIVLAHTAAPVTVIYNYPNATYDQTTKGLYAAIRPDVVGGIPLYLYGSEYPGGKRINNTPGAVPGGCPDGNPSIGPFCDVPLDANGYPIRQGNLGRNSLRAFGATQVDFAFHRDFPIREGIKLQFRAEMFDAINHPNFGSPDAGMYDPYFGLSLATLGAQLSGGGLQGTGGLSQLYQIGGPRSIQVAMKFLF